MVKKGIILCLLLTLLVGCGLTKKNMYPNFNVQFFYRDSCGHCEAFKKYAMPVLEKEFGESMNITYYNLDEDGNEAIYKEITDQLYFYDEDYQYNTPFFVLEGKFALLGYSSGEEKELVKDIIKALNNEELGTKLAAYRWEFNI